MTDCGTDPVRLAEKRFLRRDQIPLPHRGFPVAMAGRIAVYAHAEHIQELVLVCAVVILDNDLFELPVSYILRYVWKAAAHINLDNPGVAGKALTYVVYIRGKRALAGRLSFADTIVPGMLAHTPFQQRT